MYKSDEFVQKVTDAQGIVHKVCNMYCHEEEEREDFFQEIMIQLWKSYASFRGDAKFSTWMYRVALNVAIQRLRKTTQKEEFTTLPDTFEEIKNPATEDLPRKEMQLLYATIDRLNDVERAIVMLYLEEKGNEEIAVIIGITQNYVRVKMTRIRKKLKTLVEA